MVERKQEDGIEVDTGYQDGAPGAGMGRGHPGYQPVTQAELKVAEKKITKQPALAQEDYGDSLLDTM